MITDKSLSIKLRIPTILYSTLSDMFPGKVLTTDNTLSGGTQQIVH